MNARRSELALSTNYWPRRPDFAEVECGFGCVDRAALGAGAALRSGLGAFAFFGLLE
jgi:hypothetical protein